MSDPLPKRVYMASPRHCEPISAANPGVKCPAWSVAMAQALLDSAEPVGQTLQATKDGVGFVARLTSASDAEQIWHGYPEAWDKMDWGLKQRWKTLGLITGRDLRSYKTRRQVRDAFGGRLVDS